MTTFAAWKDKGFQWVITAIAAGAVSFGTWVTLSINERPTKEVVERMIDMQGPYIQDRALILKAMTDVDRTEEKLVTVIEKNTQAIRSLEIAIARIESDGK